jgi:hypothetical protein
MNDAINIMDLIKYDATKGCFVLKSEKKPVPLSPFRWKEDPRPSIFATDPHFRSRYKAGLIDSETGLKYKQFGSGTKFNKPIGNKHNT